MSVQYLVNNASIVSSTLNFVGSLAANQSITVGPEIAQQFGSCNLSIELGVIAPITFFVYATNDQSSEVWTLIETYQPIASLQTFRLNLGYRKLQVTITCGATPITGINFMLSYSTTPLSGSATIRTIDEPLQAADQYGLGRNIVMGRSKISGSTVRNTTVAGDNSLRVIDGSKMYALSDQSTLSPQVKMQMLTGYDQTYGTVSYSGGQTTLTSTLGGLSLVKTIGSVSCSNDSILVFRGAGNFTNGAAPTSEGAVYFGNKRIGIGAFGTGGLGLRYDTTGLYNIGRLAITTAVSVAGNVTITLNSSTYTLSMPTTTSFVETAKQIVVLFNAQQTLWYASQVGFNIYFTSRMPALLSTFTFGAGTTGMTASATILDAGADPTYVYIDKSTFNIDTMTSWTSGSYIEFEVVLMNNGRYAKLSYIDPVTHDLCDAHVVTLTTKLGGYGNIPLQATSIDGGSITLDSAVLSAIDDATPKRPLQYYTVQATGITSTNGFNEFPVISVAKTSMSAPVERIKKIIVVNNNPNIVYFNLSRGSAYGGGGYTVGTLTALGDMAYITSTSTVVPSGIGYISGKVVYTNTVAGSAEIDVDVGLSFGESITLTVWSGSYVTGTADISLVIEASN